MPLVLGLVLFLLNHVGILSGWMGAPQGYVGGLYRTRDIALYFSWIAGFERGWLVENFATPWKTEPAFFQPLFWLVAQAGKVVGGPTTAYLLFHLVLHLVASYSLFFALRVFTTTEKEARAAFGVTLCAVPFASLGILPSFLMRGGRKWPLLGINKFVWDSSDGLFHGIGGSILVTFGTAMTLLAFACIASYVQSGWLRYLRGACLAALGVAAAHATEASLIVVAGGLSLLLCGRWRAALALGASCCLGLLPNGLQAVRTPWMQDLADMSRWQLPGSPLVVLQMLGVPTVVALALLVSRRRIDGDTDRVLACWFGGVLLLINVPIMPSPQHLFDGFHYATGMLVVRLFCQTPGLIGLWSRYPRAALCAFSLICALSLLACATYYRQSFVDGRAVRPDRLMSTIAPSEELRAVLWMRHNARRDDLVLAPPDRAGSFLAVPMHSFAGHWHWSLRPERLHDRMAEAFFRAEHGCEPSRNLLTEYGVRFVVISGDSAVESCLTGYPERARFGSLRILEIPGHSIKPYPSPGR